MGTSWGLFLCDCRKTLPVDPDQLSFPTVPSVFSFASDPERDIGEFANRAAGQGVERVMVCCCASESLFEQAFQADNARSLKLHFLDLKKTCFKIPQQTRQAHDRATRLLRSAMAAAEVEATVDYRPFTVENRVLIAADSSRAFRLAERLEGFGQPMLVIGASLSASEMDARWPVSTGHLLEISGRLGDFHATIEGLDGAGNVRRQVSADQVVVIAHGRQLDFKNHTGCYVRTDPSDADLDLVAECIRNHTGDFLKPVHVTYASETCAGGSADQESCGICIKVCPYEAIGRDPQNHLRVYLNHAGCEGCGACVSACPTSALKFATPPPEAFYARLSALLRPVGNGTGNSEDMLVFHCGEQGKRVVEEAGRAGSNCPASAFPIEMACLRHVSEANILAAFRMGAAGVALLGCDSCPHGEREMLYQKMDFCGSILQAFGLGSERLRLLTTEPGAEAQAIQTLHAFAANLSPSPVRWDGRPLGRLDNRAIISEAIAGLIEQTGREPGRMVFDADLPFAFAEVKESGCTLCRSCVNVCPVHAFRLEDHTQSLQFKPMACVACGLCEKVCPEHVITLRREIDLEKNALDYQTLVDDHMVSCAKCGKPYINRKALEAVEGRLFSMEALLDTFGGHRKHWLRMCPDCRAVDAMLEVEKGWKP